MPNIFIIMGEKNTRKSATIRALTGVHHKTRRGYQIGTPRGDINVFIKISSLQESPISPQDFITDIQNRNYQNVLISLWISQGNGQPNGVTYIREFLNVGWNISQIVVLGTDNIQNSPQNTPVPYYISNSRTLPSNTIASQIRERWQWL